MSTLSALLVLYISKRKSSNQKLNLCHEKIKLKQEKIDRCVNRFFPPIVNFAIFSNYCSLYYGLSLVNPNG